MTYTDLIKNIASRADCKQSLVKQIIESLGEIVVNEVKQGELLRIPCLGTFSRSERSERLGRNPATGEPLVVPAKVSVKFRAGKVLQEKVERY